MNKKWEKREINNETLVLHPALLSIKMWSCHKLVKITIFSLLQRHFENNYKLYRDSKDNVVTHTNRNTVIFIATKDSKKFS